MRRFLIGMVLLTACGSPPHLAHPVSGATAELPPRLVDVANERDLGFDELIERLLEARVVCVGERHDEAADHELQLAVLRALHARDPSLAIGFEMFQRPYQGALDEFAAGTLDEAGLLERVEWDERWGFDFGMYRPLLAFGREHRLPLVALNARREITRTIAREGLEGLSEEERAELPQLTLDLTAHRERAMEVFREHPGLSDEGLERFYTAQVVWDETMAHTAARFLLEHPDVRRIVVFAGTMHVMRDAIPLRTEGRGAGPARTLLPLDEEEAGALADAPADFVVLYPR